MEDKQEKSSVSKIMFYSMDEQTLPCHTSLPPARPAWPEPASAFRRAGCAVGQALTRQKTRPGSIGSGPASSTFILFPNADAHHLKQEILTEIFQSNQVQLTFRAGGDETQTPEHQRATRTCLLCRRGCQDPCSPVRRDPGPGTDVQAVNKLQRR